MADTVEAGLEFITHNFTQNDRIIVWGYSFGGDAAINLCRVLKDEGYKVEYLVIVDSTDGTGNNTVDYKSTVAPIIPTSKFIGWGHAGVTENCYHNSLEQLRQAGHWVKSERWNIKWDGTKELNDNIFQLHLDSDVAGMKKGAQKEMFKKSLVYLKQAMNSKIPVMIGLDYKPEYANDDLITDHFAVITGCGKDSNGKLYFHVTDNAFYYQKYYCNCEKYEIKSGDDQIIISQIRESKKR